MAAKWSVLTYIAAHNNLELLGKVSRQQIVDVGSTADVVHGILYDGSMGGVRHVVGSPGKIRAQDALGAFNSGDPNALIETAKWFFGQSRAERYGLVLWSHGTGWEPAEIEVIAKEARPKARSDPGEARERSSAPGGHALFRSTLRAILSADKPAERAILFDDGSGHSLDTIELARVANVIAESIGQPLDFLGMDACLMGNLEVAYEIHGNVRYLVASEEMVPGHSWPYRDIFGELRDNPCRSGADLARRVIDQYVSAYKSHPPTEADITKVALDLSRITDVTSALDALAAALLAEIDSQAPVVWETQECSRHHEEDPRQAGRPAADKRRTKFDFHLWDVGSLARGLSTAGAQGVKDAAQALQDVLSPGKGAVLAEGHIGNWFDGIAGLTAYLVRAPTRISPHYSKLALSRDTRWGQFVTAYHQYYA